MGAVAEMGMKVPVLLFELAIALLGVTEVSSVTPNGFLGTCSFTNLIPSSSGAYITISQDSAGTDVTSEFWAKSDTVAFGETCYFDCSNASIAGAPHYGNVWDDTGVRIVSAKEMTTAFSCQARNVLTVQPLTYGNSTVKIGRIYSASDIPADTCQTSFVNYGYDGGAHFFTQAYAPGNSDTYDSSWNYLGEIPFGSSGTVPGYCTGTFRVMAIASDQQTTLAVSSYETLTSHDAETSTNYFLGGESGSNVMNYVRGCGSDDSSCKCGLTWAPTASPTPVPTESTGYVVSGSLNISGVSMAEFLEVEFQESIRLALANITGFSTTKISLPNAQRRETLTQRYELNTESSDEATDAVDAIISASDTDQLLSSLISALATTSYNGAQPTSTVTYGSPTKSSNWESSSADVTMIVVIWVFAALVVVAVIGTVIYLHNQQKHESDGQAHAPTQATQYRGECLAGGNVSEC